MAVIVDTSVFITMERRGRELAPLLVSQGDEPMGLAPITVSELLAGAFLADSSERRRQRVAFVEEIVDEVPLLPFDLVVAETHARLWAQLRETGRLIGAHDLFIAATAVAHDYAVLTEDVRDVQRVPGLHVRRPDW